MCIMVGHYATKPTTQTVEEAAGSRYTDPVSDATRDDVARGRRVLKLLEVHHRQQRELEQVRKDLARRYASAVSKLAPSAPADAEPTAPEWPALEAATTLARDLPASLRAAVVKKLPPALADEFLGSLFSFDAIPHLPDRELELVVRRADKRALATALLGAPDTYFHAVTRRMSTRAAQMLREDMESLLASGDLRTRDVQDARRALSSVIRDVVAGE